MRGDDSMLTQRRLSMKDPSRCRWMILPLLLAGLLAGCQGQATTEKPVVEKPVVDKPVEAARSVEPVEVEATVLAPRIAIEKPVIDLGEVGTDVTCTGRFEFTNAGQAPLKILQVHMCCGVSVKGVEAGQEFAPGQGGALEFSYDTGSIPIPAITREIRMRTNDPDKAIVSFAIQAAIVRRVESTPKRLRLFLQRENAACEDVTLRSLDGKPFAITSFRSTANVLSADFDPNVTATEFVLKPRADMEKLPRNVRGVVSVNLTHPECSNIRVQFDVLPEFTVNPGQLVIWNLRAGEAVQEKLQIIGNYQDDFEVESVSSQSGIVTLLEQKRLEDRQEFRIEIKAPERKAADALLADVIEVKIKGSEIVSIPLRGIYAGG